MFCPLNSHRIKRSRVSERSYQIIKDDFHRSRFLILVANASTGHVYVITPSSQLSISSHVLQHNRNQNRECSKVTSLTLVIIIVNIMTGFHD